MSAADAKTMTRWGKVPAWWLIHPEVDADRFSILSALATYADEDGTCFPSQATLALRLKRSRPWVNRVVADLAAAGLLVKISRKRLNGGTTSCEYRLVIDQHAAVVAVTPPVVEADSPGHPGDGNQLQSQQIQVKPAPVHLHRKPTFSLSGSSLRDDWEPSAAAREEAQRLCPGADVEAHAIKFALRCRAKGYSVEPGKEDDTWLSWLVEDERLVPAARRQPRFGREAAIQSRFDAWGASAASVPSKQALVG